MAKARLKSFFSYYGSKVRIAKHYPAPNHEMIVEPFAGAAGYSLLHYDHKVNLYDINPVITGIWQYLIRTSSNEIMCLPVEGDSLDDYKVCEEARNLIGFWFARASTYPRLTRSPWSKQYKSWGWTEHIKLRIASQVDKIRHWRAETLNYANIPKYWATWFVDPPYSNKAGRDYTFNKIDYSKLGDWCKKQLGQVIVCENTGADWLPFDNFIESNTATTNKITGKYSKEAICIIDNN